MILGGYGGVGKSLSRHLLKFTDVDVTIAGHHKGKADYFAGILKAEYPNRQISSCYADAALKESMVHVFKKADLVIVTTTTPHHIVNIMDAAIETQTDMIDIFVRFDVVDQLEKYRPEIIANKMVVITQAGFHPGLPGPLIRYAKNKFDQYMTANVAMVKAREDIRRWRLETPASYWRGVMRRFDEAGLNLFAYSLTLADDFTDDEVAATFRAVRAMGVRLLGTNQTRVAMAQRVVPLAEKHGVRLCFHNHSNVSHENEIASIESMQKVLAMSRNYMINLDVGHFVGANLDPVDFITRHHDRISYLHLKDRQRNDGANLPWGQGDTPLREVLQLVKRNRYPIPCLIEYEYKSDQPVLAEVQRCHDFIRQALA